MSPYTSGPTPNAWPWLISAVCGIFIWLFRRRLSFELIASAWVVAAALSAVIGLLQYFGWAQALNPWVSQTMPGEAFANLRQRNQFATLTSIGLLALTGLLARKPPAQFLPWWMRCVAILLALGNAASSSRTGMLQWVLIVMLSALWVLPGRRRLMAFVLQSVAAYAMAVVALPWVLNAVTGLGSGGLFGRLLEAPTCASRKILWANVLTLITQKPWLGWGWGELDYAHFITLYPGPRFCEILDNAHNLPLHLAVELGIPAALAVCTGLGWIVWRAKPWRETDPVRQMAWGVLAVIMLHSMLEYPLWYGPFQMALALCVGLLWTTPAATAGADDPSGNDLMRSGKKKWSLPQYLRTLIATVSIASLVAVGIDYHRVSQIYLAPAERSAAYRDDTLNKVQGTWLFRQQARFAVLGITVLKPDNAESMYSLAQELLHYSPEPRVIEKVIESAVMLGRDDEALLYVARYRAAFPEDHARWAKGNGGP